MPETRVKVYRTREEYERDRAEAEAHGWSVVGRQWPPDGTVRVTYRFGADQLPEPAPLASPRWRHASPPPGHTLRNLLVIGAVLLAVLAGAIVTQRPKPAPTGPLATMVAEVRAGNTPRPTIRATIRPRVTAKPDGLEAWAADPGIRYRWLKASEFDCRYRTGSGCWGMLVKVSRACDNLYVELQLLDASDTVVGRTNELTGTLMAGQQAKLVLDTFEASARKARLTEMDCW